MFANVLGYWSSILGWVIPNSQKMVGITSESQDELIISNILQQNLS